MNISAILITLLIMHVELLIWLSVHRWRKARRIVNDFEWSPIREEGLAEEEEPVRAETPTLRMPPTPGVVKRHRELTASRCINRFANCDLVEEDRPLILSTGPIPAIYIRQDTQRRFRHITGYLPGGDTEGIKKL